MTFWRSSQSSLLQAMHLRRVVRLCSYSRGMHILQCNHTGQHLVVDTSIFRKASGINSIARMTHVFKERLMLQSTTRKLLRRC